MGVLLAGLLWLQNATAWRWHQYNPQVGTAIGVSVPLFTPSDPPLVSTQAARSFFAKSRIHDDTLYSLLNLRDTTGGNHLILSIPGRSGTISFPSVQDQAVAILTAHAVPTGDFRWACVLHANNGISVLATDFVIDESEPAIYLALRTSEPAVGNYTLTATYITDSGTESNNLLSSLNTSIVSWIKITHYGSASGPNYLANYMTISPSLTSWGTPVSLTLDNDAVYISGTIHSAVGLATIAVDKPNSFQLTGINISVSSYRAFLLKCRKNDLHASRLLLVNGAVPPGVAISAHGRNVWAINNQILWLTGVEGLNVEYLIYDGNSTTTGNFGAFLGQGFLLCIWRLSADLSSPNLQILARYDAVSAPSNSIPPLLQAVWVGDTLTLAWADEVDYIINSSNFTGARRFYFTQWRLTAGGPILNFQRVYVTPSQPTGDFVYMTGLATEGTQWIFWTGGVQGGGMKRLLFGSGMEVNLSATNIAGGFLAGMNWGGGAPRLTGTHILQATSFGSWTGLTRDAAGHFYGCGFAQGRQTLHPVYNSPNDTLLYDPGGKGGLWVGRLDWYRIYPHSSPHLSGTSLCAPDTLLQSTTYRGVGTLAPGTSLKGVWMPESPSLRYPVAHHWQWIETWRMSNPSPTPIDNFSFSPSSHYFPSKMPPGRYFLTGTVSRPRLRAFVDVLDTVWIRIQGTTTPSLIEADPNSSYFVSYLAGSTETTHPLAHTITSPHPMKETRFQGQLVAVTSVPWQVFPTDEGEMLYVLEETLDSVRLYRINLTLQQIYPPLRRWRRFTPSVISRTRQYGLDTVIGSNALWNIPAYFRLIWDPFSGRLLLGESNMRIRAIDVYGVRDTLALGAAIGSAHSGSRYARLGARPFTGGVFGVNAEGKLAIFATNGFYIHSSGPYDVGLFRLIPDERDSFLLRVGGNTNPSTCNGQGTPARINDVQALAVDRDTIWFAERVRDPRCGTPNNILLRRAYPSPTHPDWDIVETIDTLLYASPFFYQVYDVYYLSIPEQMIVFSTNTGVFRYRINGRRRDTLVFCSSGLNCCSYGFSTMINTLDQVRIAPLRGGSLVLAIENTLRLLSPVYCPSQIEDTLYADIPLAGPPDGAYTPLFLTPPRVKIRLPRRTMGLIDTTGILRNGVCSRGKPLSFWHYNLPLLQLSIEAPDTVCEAEEFHSTLSISPQVSEQGCVITLRGAHAIPVSRQNKVQHITNLILGLDKWQSQTEGYDTLQVTPSAKYMCFFSQASHPIRIRKAHRLLLRAFMEGPYSSNRMQSHPVLSPYHVLRYAVGLPGLSSDSLWRLPVRKGETQAEVWLPSFFASCLTSGTCPSFSQSSLSGIARIELYENPNGPRVDSLYAVIDTNGIFFPFKAWAFWRSRGSDPRFDRDTLHFCSCNTTTPKWVVVRFPHHLPLRSVQAFELPTTPGQALLLDMRDPPNLAGIPNLHYKIVEGTHRTYAATWAGNCADIQNSFLAPPVHHDTGVINAADWEFMRIRQGVTGPSALSWADLDNDGDVDALDATILIANQNALHRNARQAR
ncbi:MAG: hypothetical protein RMK98_04200 [Bacteroidia bacterium]|nr:hypothetical protein [Bacteroidia bacterium]